MQIQSFVRDRLFVRLLAAGFGLFLLPQIAGAQVSWAQWATGSTTSASFTLPNGTSGTMTLVTTACADNTGIDPPETYAYGGLGNYPATWFTPTPPSPAQFLRIRAGGACAGNPVVGTFTITFDAPVTDPVLHFINLEGAEYRFLDGVSVTRLSGNDEFTVGSPIVNTGPNQPIADGCEANDGTNANGGCGSVRIDGTFTQLRADFTDVTQGAGGGDGHLLTISTSTPLACGSGVAQTISGTAQAWTIDSTWQAPAGNSAALALNAPDGQGVQLFSGSNHALELDMATVVPAGQSVLVYLANVAGFDGPALIESSLDGTNWGAGVTHTPVTTTPQFAPFSYAVPGGGARYIRIVPQADATGDTTVEVDALSYSFQYCECAGATNLVAQPSFEEFPKCSLQAGPFGNWSPITGNIHVWGLGCGSSDWPAPDGANTVDLDGSTTGGIQQTITGLNPGQRYNLTFYMAFNPDAGALAASTRMQIGDLDQIYTSAGTAAKLGGFNRVYIEFTALSSTEVLRFNSLTGSGDPTLLAGGGAPGYGVVVDDIRVTTTNCDDFGDAPASYGDAGHTAAGPQLGLVRDNEAASTPNAGATGDDAGGTDDEDALHSSVARQGETTASVVVTALNPTALPATLAAWIDANANGTFDANERVEITVPANTASATPFTLNWSGLSPFPVSGTTTFARFRIGTTPAELASPTGSATSGEVEDHAVNLGANPQADLSITKTSSPNPYVPGGQIIYTIVASNAGPGTVFGARVQDGLPSILQNVTWTCSATNGTCPAPSGVGNVDALVDITPGGSVTFTITADVPSSARGPLVNAATIVPPPGIVDPNTPNNTSVNTNPTSPPTGPADLQITQEFPGVAPPNGLLTFRLRSRNLGSNAALNPYMTGMIPPGTTFVSVTPSTGGTCNIPGNPSAPDPVTGYPMPGAAAEPLRCTWPGLMQVGESHYMEFTVRVAPGTPTGQILWSCWWTWSETEDPYHPNNVVDAYLFVDDSQSPMGDLQVQAAAAVVSETSPDRSNGGHHFSGASTLGFETIATELAVQVGANAPMRFWVTNHGPAATRGQYALILDTPNTIQIVDIQLPQGWVSPSGPSSGVWDTGMVQPGQTVALDMTVRLLTPSALELFAQRITGSPGDPNASNERATIILDGYAPGAAGRWVAVGNVDGAGAGEILTGAGQGETPQVRVFTGTGADTGLRFFAYERPFAGGVRIASCDVNGDGVAELITAPGPGRASTIRVLSLAGGVVTELIAFDAFEASFTGGASVACADLDADGAAELIVGAGPGRAPEVQVYNVGVNSVTPRSTFLAYEAGFLGGVRVAAGAYSGRAGWLEAFGIATTPGSGRAPELRLWTAAGAPVAQVVVSSATNGVLPTLGDVNGDGQIDLILAPDDGRPELVRIFEVDSGEVLGDVPGNLPGFPVGIRTAVGVLDGGPGQPEIVIGNGPGGHPRVRVIYWPPTGPVQRLEILPLEIP